MFSCDTVLYLELQTISDGIAAFFRSRNPTVFKDQEKTPQVPKIHLADYMTKKTLGRPPLRDKYPLVELVEKFMSSSHGGADKSRATDTYNMSTTMKSMKSFVDDGLRAYCRNANIPLPKQMPSIFTLRRLGLPPDRRSKASAYYKGLLPFKRAARNVNLTKEHPDFHYTAAHVLNMAEFATNFRDEVLMLSVDNKNKIILGAPAVQASRRAEGMYLTNFLPEMPDHNFPEDDGKMVPMGYMVMACLREKLHAILFRTRHESLPFDKPPIRSVLEL